MCLGIASDRARPGEIWLSSQNRNFHNRMGKGSMAWLSSALTVAASAFDLKITEPRPLIAKLDRDRFNKLVAPKSGMPAIIHTQPQAQAGAGKSEGPAAVRQKQFAPIAGRVQRFGDHVDTDAMIAGEFCHLSDLKEIGQKAFYHFRPDFVKRVEAGENIVVAGEGWGSGSSREHAVWALKGAGVQTVIAKSFAYIHKRNLVNEALPFIILRDENFYQSVKDGDEVQVDLASATVTLNGSTYQGVSLPPVMQRIMQNGGLVADVQQALGKTRA
jgi:aconitate hydratase/homoaconitate hydratase